MAGERNLIRAGPVGSWVIASATSRGKEPKRLGMAPDRCFTSALGFFWKQYQCGHRGPCWFKLSTWGEETKKIKNRERCPSCMLELFKKVMIRCAVCGHHIAPGDPVALYSTTSKDLRVEIATILDEKTVVGCMRLDCCPSNDFFAGHWDGEKVN